MECETTTTTPHTCLTTILYPYHTLAVNASNCSVSDQLVYPFEMISMYNETWPCPRCERAI